MRTSIRLRGMPEALELRTHALRQLHFHLSRFSDAIDEVELRVSDVNGPKGGLDKRCQIILRLKRAGTVTLTVSGGDAGAAIGQAAEGTARMVARELARARDLWARG